MWKCITRLRSSLFLLGLILTLACYATTGRAAVVYWGLDTPALPADWTNVLGRVTYNDHRPPGVGAAISPSNLTFAHDNAHQNVLFRSPTFELDGSGSLTFGMNGGEGPNDLPSNASELTAGITTDSGCMGLALRDAVTGDYVLTKRRSGNGDDYQTLSWSVGDLTPYANDGRIYTLDYIDTYSGGWGWSALQKVSVPGFLSSGAPTLVWSAGADGNWSTGPWTPGTPAYPNATTSAKINTAHTVTVDGNHATQQLTALNEGKLVIAANGSLTVSGAISIAPVSTGKALTMAANSALSAQSGSVDSVSTGGNVTINVSGPGSLKVPSYAATAASVLTKGGAGTLALTNAAGSSDPLGANTTTINLNAGTLSLTGPTSQSMAIGLRGSIFTGTPDNETPMNLDNAAYTVSATRVFTGNKANTVLALPSYAGHDVLLTQQINNWNGFPQSSYGDHFVTAFSGTFTPKVTGDHNFHWDNDDRGLMYIDMDNNGVFDPGDKVGNYDWNENGTKSLVAGTAYNVIYMAQEHGGGENVNWMFTAPGLSERRVNPSDPAQAGMWNALQTTYGALDMSGKTLNVNGSAALQLTASSASFGALAINGGDLTLSGTGRAIFGSVVTSAGSRLAAGTMPLTINSGNASGDIAAGSLTKEGTGTLTLTGVNTFTGATAVNGGTLAIGNGGSGASLATTGIALANDASIAFHHADTMTLARVITGSGSLTKNGTGTLKVAAQQNYSGPTTIIGGTLKLESGGGGFRYYRFTPTLLKRPDDANSVQLSEVQFFLGDVWTAATAVSNPDGDNPGGEGPPNANDNNLGSKWLDFNKGALVYDFGSKTRFDEYNWATANDSDERDPLRWKIEGSDDNSIWTMLDDKTGTDQSVTGSRNTWVAPGESRFSGWSLGGGGGGSVDILPATTAMRIAAVGTLDLGGTSQQFASLSDDGGSGGAVINSDLGKPSVLTLNVTAGKATFSGNIRGGPGNGTISLIKKGAGTQVLTGSNTYTGNTTVEEGSLETGAISGPGNTTVADGASLLASSIVQDTLTIGAGGSVTIRATPGSAGEANAVSEPSTWILMAVGLLCWAVFRSLRSRY
jgi:autotransporter-associated beta strand protein